MKALLIEDNGNVLERRVKSWTPLCEIREKRYPFRKRLFVCLGASKRPKFLIYQEKV